MKLCYGKRLNQTKNFASRGDESGMPQIAKASKQRKLRVAQLYPQALGFLCFASYDPQGYAGGILIRLHRR
jgi:hypothetical protein